MRAGPVRAFTGDPASWQLGDRSITTISRSGSQARPRDICRCRASLQRHAKAFNGTRGREAVGAFRAQACFPPGSDPKVFAAGLVDLLGNVPAHASQRLRIGPRTFDLYQSINLGRPLARQSPPRFPKSLCPVMILFCRYDGFLKLAPGRTVMRLEAA